MLPATSGSTSGSGFAMAKTIASLFMAAMSSSSRTFGAETPMNTSDPATASFREPVKFSGLVFAANQLRCSSV